MGSVRAVRPLIVKAAPTPKMKNRFAPLSGREMSDITRSLLALGPLAGSELVRIFLEADEDEEVRFATARILVTLGYYHIWNGDNATVSRLAEVYWTADEHLKLYIIVVFAYLLGGTKKQFEHIISPIHKAALSKGSEDMSENVNGAIERMNRDISTSVIEDLRRFGLGNRFQQIPEWMQKWW